MIKFPTGKRKGMSHKVNTTEMSNPYPLFNSNTNPTPNQKTATDGQCSALAKSLETPSGGLYGLANKLGLTQTMSILPEYGYRVIFHLAFPASV